MVHGHQPYLWFPQQFALSRVVGIYQHISASILFVSVTKLRTQCHMTPCLQFCCVHLSCAELNLLHSPTGAKRPGVDLHTIFNTFHLYLALSEMPEAPHLIVHCHEAHGPKYRTLTLTSDAVLVFVFDIQHRTHIHSYSSRLQHSTQTHTTYPASSFHSILQVFNNQPTN